MHLISCEYDLGTSTFGDIEFQVTAIQLLSNNYGDGSLRRASLKGPDDKPLSEVIEEFYSSKMTADISMNPISIKVEVDNPEDYGIEAVVLRVSADYHDDTVSRYRNLGSKDFFCEQLLIPIASACGIGTGYSTDTFRALLHAKYLAARKAVIKNQENQ